jgi:chemotaxis protein CheC
MNALSSIILSEVQKDVLREMVNIGIGRAADTMNRMTSSHVRMDVPRLHLKTLEEALLLYPDDHGAKVSVVRQGFDGLFSGLSVLYFTPEEASQLVFIILGEEPPPAELDMLRAGTLQEVGNIVLNGVMGSIANMLDGHFSYVPPDFFEAPFADLLKQQANKSTVLLIIETTFLLEKHVIKGRVLIMFDENAFTALLGAIDALIYKMGMG